MYTVRRPVENVYLVREPDRRRTRELLALLLSPLPPMAVLFAAIWTNLETFRLGYQIERLQKQKETLVELGRFLDDAIARLSLGARLAVLSYHSLEDRIVKDTLRERSAGCSCPPSFPVCVCSRRRVLALVTKKPVRPTPEEVFENRRARSARMRVAERIVPGSPRSG